MSEPDTPHQKIDQMGVVDDEVHGSPGKLLRAAREAAGIHVAALAGSLKIPVSRLDALENDDFSALPDAVFARALASSICRTLDLDPATVLKLMPKNEVFSFSSAGPGINASFKDGSRKTGKNYFLEHTMRPMGAAVVLLLLGVLVLLFVPFGNDAPAIIDKNLNIESSNSKLENPAISMSLVPVLPDLAAASESTAVDIAVPAVATSVVSVPVTSALAAVAVPVVAHPAVPEAPTLTAPAELLQFRSLGESWVQVRDATKNVVFERTLAKGQTASVTGILPLSVVIGRADMTEVLVRGKFFELSGVAKENVARFEVKQ